MKIVIPIKPVTVSDELENYRTAYNNTYDKLSNLTYEVEYKTQFTVYVTANEIILSE